MELEPSGTAVKLSITHTIVPAMYLSSYTVGSTTSSDTISGFSSRGPVTVDGSNLRKPDLTAPGDNVRSSVPGGGYESWGGTSMAGPHVAGAVALLISAHPEMRGQVDNIETTINQSALHIPWTGCSSSGVPNNSYGWGRIDALAALSVDQLEIAAGVQPRRGAPRKKPGAAGLGLCAWHRSLTSWARARVFP